MKAGTVEISACRAGKVLLERFAARQRRELLAASFASFRAASQLAKQAAEEADKRMAQGRRSVLKSALQVWKERVRASAEADAAADMMSR